MRMMTASEYGFYLFHEKFAPFSYMKKFTKNMYEESFMRFGEIDMQSIVQCAIPFLPEIVSLRAYHVRDISYTQNGMLQPIHLHETIREALESGEIDDPKDFLTKLIGSSLEFGLAETFEEDLWQDLQVLLVVHRVFHTDQQDIFYCPKAHLW